MKVLVVCLFVVLFAGAAHAQRVPSSCTAPDSVMQLYRIDAAWAAIYARQTNEVEISQSLQDSLLRAMIAVYNCGLRSADSILGRVVLKTWYPPYPLESNVHWLDTTDIRRVRINLDLTVPWQNRLFHGVLPTGNVEVDDLLIRYNLSVVDTQSFDYRGVLDLRSEAVINSQVLGAVWDSVSGTKSAYPPWYAGEAEINASLLDSTIRLTYHIGHGDCPSGCVWNHYWTFIMYPDCSVEALASYGDPLGTDGVERSPTSNNEPSIRPDPADGVVSVESQPLSTIEITTLGGVVVVRTSSVTDQTQLSISGLAAGHYSVRVTGPDGQIQTGKFVKR